MRRCVMFFIACVILCTFALAGCVGEEVGISINADGSGKAFVTYGFTKEAVEILYEQGVDAEFISKLKEIKMGQFTYYGQTNQYIFPSIEEFNSLFGQNFMMDYGVANLSLSEIDGGYFCLTLKIKKEYKSFREILLSLYPDLTDSDIARILPYMSFNFNFTLPGNSYCMNMDISKNVYVSIKGCTLNIDFRGLYDSQKEDEREYKFLITPQPDIFFLDVSDDNWGRNSIYSLAYGGLVKGIGNNLFNPNGNVTRGEFYTILARALGMATYEKNDYWAYGGIYSCGTNKLIVNWSENENNGILKKEDWEVPISREETVSAVYLAYLWGRVYKPYHSNIKENYVPDYSSIDLKYAENILGAYQYGIINGVDESHTFNPKGLLKRVEVCQIFFNIGWCSPIL